MNLFVRTTRNTNILPSSRPSSTLFLLLFPRLCRGFVSTSSAAGGASSCSSNTGRMLWSSSEGIGSTSASGTTKVAQFLSQPYMDRLLNVEDPNIRDPRTVLSFFLGVDYKDDSDVEEKLVYGQSLTTMPSFWFTMDAEYDEACRRYFADAVRDAGAKKLDERSGDGESSNNMWTTTVDGLTAQLILCDQLSRNAFRGTPEAFQYDENSIEVARELAHEALSSSSGLKGGFYLPYYYLMVMAMMHSESLNDHEAALEILRLSEDRSNQHDRSHNLLRAWKMQMEHLLDHKVVVEKFGRYPHRNGLLGRASTKEEEIWLDDVDNLPAWAKSQM